MIMEINDITFKIRGAIFTVHNELGPGLLESVYEAALKYELQFLGLIINTQVEVPVYYKGKYLEIGFRIDLLVEYSVIVEIKSLESLRDLHKKQLLNYLKILKMKSEY